MCLLYINYIHCFVDSSQSNQSSTMVTSSTATAASHPNLPARVNGSNNTTGSSQFRPMHHSPLHSGWPSNATPVQQHYRPASLTKVFNAKSDYFSSPPPPPTTAAVAAYQPHCLYSGPSSFAGRPVMGSVGFPAIPERHYHDAAGPNEAVRDQPPYLSAAAGTHQFAIRVDVNQTAAFCSGATQQGASSTGLADTDHHHQQQQRSYGVPTAAAAAATAGSMPTMMDWRR